MEDYETLRQRHVGDLGPIMMRLVQHIAWSREQIEQERTEGLRRIVSLAREKSAWHRERLAGVDVETLTIANMTAALPTMTKNDLMTNWDEIVTDPRLTLELVNKHLETITTGTYLFDTYHAVASGGSSGVRGVFVWDWDGWAMAYAGLARWPFRYMSSMPPPPDGRRVIAAVAAEGATHMSGAAAQTFSNPMVQMHQFPVTLPMSQIVDGLNASQPGSLVGYSSVLFELAHEARAGRLRISPKTIAPNAEPLRPEMRAAMVEAWGVPVGSSWAMSEAGAVGQSCFTGEGMHLAEDLMIVEPVDAQGRPAKPGELSAKIYLTNLINTALPLIRYEVTDEVRVLTEPCPCGSVFGRVDDVQGRLEDIFRYPSGVLIHPLLFDSPLSRNPEIIEYQVLQTEGGAMVYVRCASAIDVGVIAADIVTNLEGAGLAGAMISVERVEAIKRTAAGKLKRFVAL